MASISPRRLQARNNVLVIAPSRSLSLISKECRQNAIDVFQREFGLNISFSKHCEETDLFASSAIASRVKDLHDGFSDKKVKAIFTVIGGYNCNQLLDHLDYELIKENPKIFCGYSDITALSCGIYKKTSMVTFSGPHFSTFGCLKGMNYIIDYFKSLMTNWPVNVLPASTWSDDAWYLDQNNRTFFQNDGFVIINKGAAKGVIMGGNLCTLNLLHGTEYMPDLSNAILFIEDDYLVFPEIFDRDLQSLVMQPRFAGIKGIVIGRFQRESKMSFATITEICRRKKELADIPIIANADFGHTMPMFTFPIGGRATLDAQEAIPSLMVEW